MNEVLFPSPTSPPYTLPLTREAFMVALQKGHGRAWQHATAHGIADRVDLVVHACMHNLSYDPQCEGRRAPWMLGLIEAARAEDTVFPRLLEQVAQTPQDENRFWHELQRSTLMKHLVDRGIEEARPLLYGLFRASADSLDLVGGEEIIELDGADGLIHICETLGRSLADDPGATCSDVPLDHFDRLHGHGSAHKVLLTVASSNPDVARYLNHLASQRERRERHRYRSPSDLQVTPGAQDARWRHDERTVEDVIAAVQAAGPGRTGYWLTRWGQAASGEHLAAIAAALERETTASRLAAYLRVFHRRPPPAVTEKMMSLAQHEDAQVRWSAYRALSQVKAPRVRELAIRLLRPERMAEGALRLFESNYEPGDSRRIEGVLPIPHDREDLHTLVFDLIDVFTHHPSSESHRLMLFVYEQSPCSNCRSGAVDLLHAGGALPAWLIAEARFDAAEQVRNRVLETDHED